MDKTEQFIKMSDCPEVQKYRKGQKDFHIGDLIANFLLGKYSKANFQGIVIFEQHDEIRERQLAVWLPRQDDIQKMMRKDYKNTLDMLCDFYAVITVDQPTGFQQMFEVSMEQLWLVFYMYKKHKKKWNGERWK